MRTPLLTPVYVALFVILFCKLPKSQSVNTILVKIGDHSMNMWLIHAWYCFIVFKDELYQLRYPLFVFLAVLIVSYLSSLLINMIAVPLSKWLVARLFKAGKT